VRLDRFVDERSAGWDELAELVRVAGRRPERMDPQRLLRLGARYRAAAADLALARRAFPQDPVTRRLERLVGEARSCVYADEPRRGSLRGFLTTRYPQRVMERPVLLAVALALMFVPMALAAVWALDDPGAAVGIVPSQFRAAADPGGPGTLGGAQEARLSSEIFTNNIQVTFLAVAGGLLLGIGTAAVVLYNGGFVGALLGVTVANGAAGEFLRLTVPHGLLELSCIGVCAAAGLRVGWAVVEPGTRTRIAALREEALGAMEVVLGTMPWLVLAGLIEGFVTGNVGSLPVALLIGVAAAGPFWALLLVRGRGGHSLARAFARR
jgi:uncharacterized membrane protein SpoIIM required for sporulation